MDLPLKTKNGSVRFSLITYQFKKKNATYQKRWKQIKREVSSVSMSQCGKSNYFLLNFLWLYHHAYNKLSIQFTTCDIPITSHILHAVT